ncbi:uncharacterized protein BJ212DRAFT_942421 [Suillus subaureus]|uniref:Uncharacterized protein n=1 Tax=Suillus subaureus TaxID=48587 RepID=A0A9P7DFY0_9AGAM|nr:uncharacterized protein BJ212DRAFT_942421 [Suillus subaureus]KAG1791293.1 hypothetical protein BJ212DRAFT_942421 [Suillus subaureus]
MPSSSEQASDQISLSSAGPEASQTTLNKHSNHSLIKPISRFYNALAGDYIPLRSDERSTKTRHGLRYPLGETARVWCILVRRSSLLLRRFHDLPFIRPQSRKICFGI